MHTFGKIYAECSAEEREECNMAIREKGMSEAAKPDFLDLDGDGDKKEPMKKAAKDKKKSMSKAKK
jgi:hypothetical protein